MSNYFMDLGLNAFGLNRYRLDVNQLSDQQCHMVYSIKPLDDQHIVATALEHLTFHPKTAINKKFHVRKVEIANLTLAIVSFPKEFLETCLKVAKTQGFTRMEKSRAMKFSKLFVEIPASERLVLFTPSTPKNFSEIEKECDLVSFIGDAFQKLGID